jgi:hypothetical protein
MREVTDGVWTTVREHTVDRCRLIRTLREAGQAAVGAGSSVVRSSGWPESFVVQVVRVTSGRVSRIEATSTCRQEVQCVVSPELAWAHSPDALGVLGAWVEENIRHALDNPDSVAVGSVPGPILARDPYSGGSS